MDASRKELAPYCWLPPHIYACHFSHGTVLLDLKGNRYFGLGSGPASILKDLLSSNDSTSAPSKAEQLQQWINRGLLQTFPSPRLFCPGSIDLREALTPLEKCPRDSSGPLDVALFVWHLAGAHIALRRQSLYDIAVQLRASRDRKCRSAHGNPERLQIAVARFRRLRPGVFAVHDRCLLHALALARYLVAQRLPATWVIGVRLRPWGAHSWVQSGSMLLDTTPEIVREFTPIIAV